MAMTRHLSVVARSLPVVLALVLMSGLGVSAPARADTHRRAGIPAAAAEQILHQDTVSAAPVRAGEPTVAVTAAQAPVADATREQPAQRVADVHRSRAPPAAVR